MVPAFAFFTTYGQGVRNYLTYVAPADADPDYNVFTDPAQIDNLTAAQLEEDKQAALTMESLYSRYMDTHVMLLVGFSFIQTAPKTHSWSSLAFTLLTACWTIQLNALTQAFWSQWLAGTWQLVELNLGTLIDGDYAAIAVLVSMGALCGKLRFGQMFILASVEVCVYGLNRALCVLIGLHDIGGTVTVHLFGALFGVSAAIHCS